MRRKNCHSERPTLARGICFPGSAPRKADSPRFASLRVGMTRRSFVTIFCEPQLDQQAAGRSAQFSLDFSVPSQSSALGQPPRTPFGCAQGRLRRTKEILRIEAFVVLRVLRGYCLLRRSLNQSTTEPSLCSTSRTALTFAMLRARRLRFRPVPGVAGFDPAVYDGSLEIA